MSTTVQNIKERLSITDVISSYIDIEKSGGNFKAKCPFHQEKTASFYISPDRNSYYCFGCGVKGDIFTFVQEFEGVDFVAALKMLADRAGVVIERFEKQEKNTDERLFAAMEEATKFFQANLKENKDALSYLQKRNLEIETLRSWRLGFALDDWRSLKNHLIKSGFTEKEMLDAGLIKTNEKGESYDRFRGRVMFPIFDTAGRVIAFSGRILVAKDEEPKYLNSPDTSLFDKSRTLYGFNNAKVSIKHEKSVILVEGQMDLLMSHQAGFKNTVASSGTALTASHLEILKRLTSTIIIAYDGDNAGRNATLRAWKLALAEGFETKIAFLGGGLDPADAIAKDQGIWKDAIINAKHIIDYFLENMQSEKETPKADLILKEKILPLIKYIGSAIERSRFIQKTSFISGIGEAALLEELNKLKDEEIVEKSIELPKILKTKIPQALSFYTYLVSKGNAYKDTFKTSLLEINKNFEGILPEDENEKSKILFEIEMQYGERNDLENVGRELLYHFEEETLKEDFTKTMERLKRLEALHDMGGVEEELKHCQEISQKLSGLSKKYAST